MRRTVARIVYVSVNVDSAGHEVIAPEGRVVVRDVDAGVAPQEVPIARRDAGDQQDRHDEENDDHEQGRHGVQESLQHPGPLPAEPATRSSRSDTRRGADHGRSMTQTRDALQT